MLARFDKSFVEKFPTGAIITIFADPVNPAKSTFEDVGDVSSERLLILAFAALIVLTIAIAIRS